MGAALERTNITDEQRASLGVGDTATVGDALIGQKGYTDSQVATATAGKATRYMQSGDILLSTQSAVPGFSRQGGQDAGKITGIPNVNHTIEHLTAYPVSVVKNGVEYLFQRSGDKVTCYQGNAGGSKWTYTLTDIGNNSPEAYVYTGGVVYKSGTTAWYIPMSAIPSNKTIPIQRYSLVPRMKFRNVYIQNGASLIVYDSNGNAIKTFAVNGGSDVIYISSAIWAYTSNSMWVTSYGNVKSNAVVITDGYDLFYVLGKMVYSCKTNEFVCCVPWNIYTFDSNYPFADGYGSIVDGWLFTPYHTWEYVGGARICNNGYVSDTYRWYMANSTPYVGLGWTI